jgi:hypothetical protein
MLIGHREKQYRSAAHPYVWPFTHFTSIQMGVFPPFVVKGETSTTMTTRNTLLIAALAFTTSIFAQDDAPMRTLLGGEDKISHGGWGAPTTHYTRIMDQDALLVGGRGGWLINHRVTIGLAAHGLTTPVYNEAYDSYLFNGGISPQRKSILNMGYGGLLIEPIIAYKSPVHISLPIIIGAGGVGYQYYSNLPHEPNHLTYDDHAQAFFVVEPGIELEMNIIPLVRLGLGASYRYTSDINIPETPEDALHGLNAGVSIKIGKF